MVPNRKCAAGDKSPKLSLNRGTTIWLRKVYEPEVYLEAARMLVEEGLLDEADNPLGYRWL